jgi:protein-L-isoaspartate(D-aspartate) O-methyltransferase
MKGLREEHLAVLRRHMVDVVAIHADLASEDLGKAALDERVMEAMRAVPRHDFVLGPLTHLAYEDSPLPIGFDKTVSQPFIVALMADLLGVEPHDSVLEVGTGLGYQAAVLSRLARRVWTVEIVEEFANEAEARLRRIGCANVAIRTGDGSRGWAEHAPFDRILVAAAADEPPRALLDQLKPEGRLVMPVGSSEAQMLAVFEKDPAGAVARRDVLPVRFGQLETI